MHLFQLFDENLLRYSAMFLSFVGLIKNNFITETFLAAPAPAQFSPDYDIAFTQFLIGQMAQVSKGVLAISTFLSFLSSFFDGAGFLPETDLVPFFWNIMMYALMFWGAQLGLMQKYGFQTILNDWAPEAVRAGILKMIVVNFLPDIFTGVVPLFMTFLRLDQYRDSHLQY